MLVSRSINTMALVKEHFWRKNTCHRTQAVSKETARAGAVADRFKADVEYNNVETGKHSDFWHTTICSKQNKCVEEPENIETEEEKDSEEVSLLRIHKMR